MYWFPLGMLVLGLLQCIVSYYFQPKRPNCGHLVKTTKLQYGQINYLVGSISKYVYTKVIDIHQTTRYSV